MKKYNFILSFLSSILCVYLLRIFWTEIALFLYKNLSWSAFSVIIEILSPFLSYWIIKKYFFNNLKIQDLFLNYASVKKYTVSLFLIEGIALLLLIIAGMDLAGVIFIYLIFLSHFFSAIWYLPFLIIAYVNKSRNDK